MGVLGVILALLAVVAGFVATVMFGTGGGIAAIVLAVLAVVCAILKRKKDGKGGTAAIVIAVLAAILAIAMMSTTNTLVVKLKDEMIKSSGDKYLVARKYAEKADTNGGFVGFINSMLNNVPEEDKAQLEKELKDMTELLNDAMGNTKEEAEKKTEEIKKDVEQKVDEIKDDAEQKVDEIKEEVEQTVDQITEETGTAQES